MGVAELKSKLHDVINAINDQNKLEALYSLLKDTKSKYATMSLEEYVGAIEEAILQVKRGDFSSVEDFEKESENW
ncbi:MAG: hypothetical protein ACXIUD_09450 [Mongoliitalea sp.]